MTGQTVDAALANVVERDDHNLDLNSGRNRQRIWDKTGGICWYCGKRMQPFVDFVIDHVVPKANGGRNSYGNLVPCCDPCNRRKGAKSVEEFRILMTRPSFTPVQRQFLSSIGVDIDAVPAYRFWFERKGGKP